MRITKHPILKIPDRKAVKFFFNDKLMTGLESEPITSSLIANGISVFGHHHLDGAAQGIFCVNGQCSQCLVIADGKTVKGCMTEISEGLKVYSCDKIPELIDTKSTPEFGEVEELSTDVLIIGAGPSGIAAALELGRQGIQTLLVDDKTSLGGKLTLQTHPFFGSKEACWAGVRGIDIATILSDELQKFFSVRVMLKTSAVGCFSDKKIGIVEHGNKYYLVTPKSLLIATGARERTVTFPGCDLVGVYGAGAFQTLVNRDLVQSAKKLFILGGGNVGLIGAYHALQAGIEVLGLAEGLPYCGGYKVHQDKILRLGVPIFTSHTVIRAEGTKEGILERVTIGAVDQNFKTISGTEKEFEVDSLLVAVGLLSVDELYKDAAKYGMRAYVAGDAQAIAEASAAIFSGKIIGRRIAKDFGANVEIPPEWDSLQKILESRPGENHTYQWPERDNVRIYPIIRCTQEIPCDPCVHACAKNLIKLKGTSIMDIPEFDEQGVCTGCGMCVLVCPGLAISLLYPNHDPDKKVAKLMLPYELDPDSIRKAQMVSCVDADGKEICEGKIIDIVERKKIDQRRLIMIEVPYEFRYKIATFKLMSPRKYSKGSPVLSSEAADEATIICRCGRVNKTQVKREIRKGVRDMNTLKALLYAGLGACGGKTCTQLIKQIFREEGISPDEITPPSSRPLEAEVPLSVFADIKADIKRPK